MILDPVCAAPVFPKETKNIDIDDHARRWNLNSDQRRAFSIVAQHSLNDGADPLRMFLGGAGGTGKSRVIHALTSFFAERLQPRRLRLASYTGIAARHIKGTTVHAALSLDKRRKGKIGSKTRHDLDAMWDGVDYFLIDEVSMIGCKFLTAISEALS
ncbi:hypothetical protein FKP32DRAFT_1563012, partial [Trametes sanguinea]